MAYVKSIFSVWIHSVREEKAQTQIFSAQFLTGSIWQQIAAWPLHRWDIHLSLDCRLSFTMASFSLHLRTIFYSHRFDHLPNQTGDCQYGPRHPYTLSLHWFVCFIDRYYIVFAFHMMNTIKYHLAVKHWLFAYEISAVYLPLRQFFLCIWDFFLSCNFCKIYVGFYGDSYTTATTLTSIFPSYFRGICWRTFHMKFQHY